MLLVCIISIEGLGTLLDAQNEQVPDTPVHRLNRLVNRYVSRVSSDEYCVLYFLFFFLVVHSPYPISCV